MPRCLSAMMVFTCLLAASQPGALRADEAADALAAKVLAAYRAAPAYQAAMTFTMGSRDGRWTRTQSADVTLLYDRATRRILIDTPTLALASDGKQFKMKIYELPGTHLESAGPGELSYDALVAFTTPPQFGSLIALPTMVPDLILLTAADPLATLAGAAKEKPKTEAVEPDPADAQKRPGLRITAANGAWTLRVDPKSFLVTRAVFDVDGGAKPNGDYERYTYDISLAPEDRPIDAARFTLDVTGSIAAKSFPELVQVAQSIAPPFELKTPAGVTVKLSALKEEVVILDFWATWCGPCRRGLPELEKVFTWAKENKKPVAIYAVNLQETADLVTPFWDQMKLTMPVLMDGDGKVSNAYRVESIPHTVVIHKGRIVDMHVGFDPQMKEKLTAQIDRLLKGEDKPKPPAVAPPEN